MVIKVSNLNKLNGVGAEGAPGHDREGLPRPLLLPPPPPPPSWAGHATHARDVARNGPTVRWLEGWPGGIQLDVVNLVTGLAGDGKTSVVSYVAVDQSKRGRHVLIYRSPEDSLAKWAGRMELMGGNLDYIHFTDDVQKVWSILGRSDAPHLLIIDPLQHFLNTGTYYGGTARAMMTNLGDYAIKHTMAVLAVIHWDPDRNRIMGNKEIHRIARVHLKVESDDDGTYRSRLIRIKCNDVPRNYFLPFHTFKTTPTDISEPAQVAFESTVWEKLSRGKEARAKQLARFVRETTQGKPYPVKSLKREAADQGSLIYRSDIAPWLYNHGWEQDRAGQRGPYYWVPPPGRSDYQWSPDSGCYLMKQPDGGWLKLEEPLPPAAERQ